ncbi:disease resistance protein RGA5 [Rosa sericea]
MKQKIVMKVPMYCRKCQTKALKIVAKENGVSFVALGEEKDSVVVIGEGVDAIKLAKSLRKKFKNTHIITVAEV